MLVLKTRYQKLSRVVFAPDGRGLAAAGDRGAYWWRSVFDDPKAVRLGEEWCGGAGFTPNGGHLLTLPRGVGLCATDLADQSRRVVPVGGYYISLAVCPATGLAVVEPGGEMTGWRVGPDGAPARVWAVRPGAGSIGSSVAFAPDGSWFVRAARVGEEWQGYRFDLRDPATGAMIRSCPSNWVTWVSCGPAVSPDKEWIAYATQHVLHAQSVSDSERRHADTNDNTHQYTGMAFHPSGRFLAVTNNDTTVKLYDTSTWGVARTFTWETGRMRSIAFSPDGTLAAAGSDSGKVVVWDVDL